LAVLEAIALVLGLPHTLVVAAALETTQMEILVVVAVVQGRELSLAALIRVEQQHKHLVELLLLEMLVETLVLTAALLLAAAVDGLVEEALVFLILGMVHMAVMEPLELPIITLGVLQQVLEN
jgi:hypothetical protein